LSTFLSVKQGRAQRWLLLALVAVLVASIALSSNAGRTQAVGVASGIYFGAYGGSETLQTATDIASVGVQSARMEVRWDLLEPSEAYAALPLQSTSDLGRYDDRLRNLSGLGIKPIIMIGGAPPWAAPRERGPLHADKYDEFAAFMGKLVARWSAAPYNVKHWELWPEPDYGNDPTSLRAAWGDNGAQYAQMLQTTYPAIKAADSSATVIMGSMAHDAFRNDNSPGFNAGGPFSYSFLEDVLRAGGGAYVDWIAFNSYSVFATGWEQNVSGSERDMAAKAKHIRGRMALHNVNKPLLSLEGGIWSCCQPGRQPGLNFYVMPNGEVGDYAPDERTQAAYLAQMYARGLAADLVGVFWYLVYDQQARNVLTEPDSHRGWWDRDRNIKPAGQTMRLVTSRLSGTTYGGAYTGATVESGPEIEAYNYTRPNGQTVTVMWSPFSPNESSRVRFPGTGAIVYNIHGETVATERADGSDIRVTVGFSPIIVEQFGSLGNKSVIPNVPRNQAGI
jgi:hypothetical protein